MEYTKEQLLDIGTRGARVAWARFVKLFPDEKIGEIPRIEMNGRLTSTAGRAWLDRNMIDLSVPLMREFASQFLADTIPHELAHFVAWRVFKDNGHGPAWKYVMRRYGIEPSRCHTYHAQRALKARLKEMK